MYDVDDLAAAEARFDELTAEAEQRFEELQVDAEPNLPMQLLLLLARDRLTPIAVEDIEALIHPDVEVRSHVTLGYGELTRDQLIKAWTIDDDALLTESVRFEVGTVHLRTDEAVLVDVRAETRGTWHHLWLFGMANGQIDRMEFFDVADLAAAEQRFQALYG
jgi:hypothetical protein